MATAGCLRLGAVGGAVLYPYTSSVTATVFRRSG